MPVQCLGNFGPFCCVPSALWDGSTYGSYDSNPPYGPEYQYPPDKPPASLRSVGPGTYYPIALSLTKAMEWFWKVKRWLVTPNFTVTSTDIYITDATNEDSEFSDFTHTVNFEYRCNTPFYLTDSRTTMASCICGRNLTGSGGSDGLDPVTTDTSSGEDFLTQLIQAPMFMEAYMLSGSPSRIYVGESDEDDYYPRINIRSDGLFGAKHNTRTYDGPTTSIYPSATTGLSVTVDGYNMNLYQTVYGDTIVVEEYDNETFTYTYGDRTFSGSITITPDEYYT